MANKYLTWPVPQNNAQRAVQYVGPVAGVLRNLLNTKVQQYEQIRLMTLHPPAGVALADVITASGLTSTQVGQLLSLMKAEIVAAATILGDTATFAGDDTVAAAVITLQS